MAEATAFSIFMAAGIASGAWHLSKMITPLNDPFNPLISTEGDTMLQYCLLFLSVAERHKIQTRWQDAMKRCHMTS